MEKQLFIGGFGGQGVALVGKMIGECAAEEGVDCAVFPEYEPQMRNAATLVTIVTSTEQVESPILEKFDYIVAFDQRTWDEHRNRIKQGGILLINSDLVHFKDTSADKTLLNEVKVVEVPINTIAKELGNDKTANIVMLGAICKVSEIVGKDSLKNILKKHFIGKEKIIRINFEAFDKGFEIASAQLV